MEHYRFSFPSIVSADAENIYMGTQIEKNQFVAAMVQLMASTLVTIMQKARSHLRN